MRGRGSLPGHIPSRQVSAEYKRGVNVTDKTERKRKWRHENPEKVREYKRRDYVRRKEAIKAIIYASIAHRKGKIGKSCTICGESRVVDWCHIIRRCDGGPDDDWNILYLCPTHHSLFDWHRDLMTEDEWSRIKMEVELATARFSLPSE